MAHSGFALEGEIQGLKYVSEDGEQPSPDVIEALLGMRDMHADILATQGELVPTFILRSVRGDLLPIVCNGESADIPEMLPFIESLAVGMRAYTVTLVQEAWFVEPEPEEELDRSVPLAQHPRRVEVLAIDTCYRDRMMMGLFRIHRGEDGRFVRLENFRAAYLPRDTKITEVPDMMPRHEVGIEESAEARARLLEQMGSDAKQMIDILKFFDHGLQ